MAGSLLEGHAEAIPLSNEAPCKFCRFGNICGNSDASVSRPPDEERLEEAKKILSEKTDIREV